MHLLVEREVFQNVMLPRYYLLWQLPGENVDDILSGLSDNGHQVPHSEQRHILPLGGSNLEQLVQPNK